MECFSEVHGVALAVANVVNASHEHREEDERLRRPATRVETGDVFVCVVLVRVVSHGLPSHRLADQGNVPETQTLVVHGHVEDAGHRHYRCTFTR